MSRTLLNLAEASQDTTYTSTGGENPTLPSSMMLEFRQGRSTVSQGSTFVTNPNEPTGLQASSCRVIESICGVYEARLGA